MVWNDTVIKGLTLRGENGAKTSITLEFGGSEPLSISGAASNCTQQQVNAYRQVRDLLTKAIVVKSPPAVDLQEILEEAGQEITPR